MLHWVRPGCSQKSLNQTQVPELSSTVQVSFNKKTKKTQFSYLSEHKFGIQWKISIHFAESIKICAIAITGIGININKGWEAVTRNDLNFASEKADQLGLARAVCFGLQWQGPLRPSMIKVIG